MATPAAVDPRMACPACGGQVHPIAGRCKHCKADLARLRNGAAPAKAQPAARPNLVALGGGNGHGQGHGLGHGTNTASAQSTSLLGSPTSPVVMVAPPAVDTSDAPRASWSSRWPLLVAAIAVIAIVASVALLLFGGGGDKKKNGVRRTDGPAPELMPTDPMAPQVTPPAPTPNPGGPHAGGIAPDPQTPDPIPAIPAPPPPPPTGAPRTATDFVTSAIDVACQRLTSCSADAQVAQHCSMARQMLPQYSSSIEQICPDYDSGAAAQCLDAVSRVPCPNGTMDPMALANTLMGLSGCQKVCPGATAMMDPDLLGG